MQTSQALRQQRCLCREKAICDRRPETFPNKDVMPMYRVQVGNEDTHVSILPQGHAWHSTGTGRGVTECLVLTGKQGQRFWTGDTVLLLPVRCLKAHSLAGQTSP